VSPEEPVKTIKCDINITDPSNLTQTLCEQLLIPSTTPPTIDSNGRLLQVQYKVVVTAELSDMVKSSLLSKLKTGSTDVQSSMHVASLHIPVKLGTLPFASMPIDPEEFADEIDTQSQISDGSTIVFGIEKAISRQSSISVPNMDLKRILARSDSITSYSSVSSSHSRQSWMSAPSGLSRNTSSTSTSSTFVQSIPDDSVPLYVMKELPTSPLSSSRYPRSDAPVYELQEIHPDIPNMVLQPLDIGIRDLSLHNNNSNSSSNCFVLSPLATTPTSPPVSRRETWPSTDVNPRPVKPPVSSNGSTSSVRTVTKSSERSKPFTTIFKDELSSDDDDGASYDTQLSTADTLINHGAGTSYSGSRHGASASAPTLPPSQYDPSYRSRRPLTNFAPFQGASDSESEEASDLSSEDSDADDPVVILSRQRRMAAKANKKRFMTIHR
jgi:hypothetical protein